MDINEAMAKIKMLNPSQSINLRGQPGIGKTAGVMQMGMDLGCKKVNVKGKLIDGIYFQLACTMDPTDISGTPWGHDLYTDWKPPRWAYELSTDYPEDFPAILFFDDLQNGDELVQTAIYRVVHEKACGHYQFRPNVRVMAASNRAEDRTGIKEMPTALRNRFLHINIECNVENWCNWAMDNGLYPAIIAYIRTQNQKLNTFDPKTNEYSFCTPRSWHMASTCLKDLGGIPEDHLSILAGLIGEGVTAEFVAFARNTQSIPKPEDILRDPEKAVVPNERQIDILYATVCSVGAYVREHPKKIENAYRYAKRLIPEFGIILAKDVCRVLLNPELTDSDTRVSIIQSPIFTELTKKWNIYLGA